MTSEPFGGYVLDTGATPYELALADTEGAELLTSPVGAILDNWDPYAIPARNLPFLAHSMGVTFWDDDWSEGVKRKWIADQWRFKALRGTEAAIRMALDLYGFTLVQMLTPPQGTYASAEFTAEERDEWVRRMPQLRLTFAVGKGTFYPDSSFAGIGFAGENFAEPDDGPELYGRRGFLRRNGVDTPLRSEVLERSGDERTLFNVERIHTQGLSTIGIFAGVDFVGDPERFVGAAEVEAEIVTVNLDPTYIHGQDGLGLDTAEVTLDPLDVRYERQSDVGQGGPATFAGVDFAGQSFAVEDDAGRLLADVLYLNDPSVAVPMTQGISFAGLDRVGIEVNTAELLIDLHTSAEPGATFADDGFAGVDFAMPEDTGPRDKAIAAVLAAKALRDTVLVSFATMRPLEFGDSFTEDTTTGQWVQDHL